jgi:hypothetical protein
VVAIYSYSDREFKEDEPGMREKAVVGLYPSKNRGKVIWNLNAEGHR